MSLSEEVIYQEGKLVTGPDSASLLPVGFNQCVDAAWDGVVGEVRLILVMELTVVPEDASLARTGHALSLLGWVDLAHELRRVLAKAHEAASVHLTGDPISAHRLISRNILSCDVLCTVLIEH